MHFKESNIVSCRYVDDLYIFVKSVSEAEQIFFETINFLRSYDLILNEAKCVLLSKNSISVEDPDLNSLFQDAVDEISNQFEFGDFGVDYGAQMDWFGDTEGHQADEEQEKLDSIIELSATKVLFDSISKYPGHEESIERFCLPLFSKSKSKYALQHVLGDFKNRMSMAQIYCSYLMNFVNENEVFESLSDWLEDAKILEWQKMWVFAALLHVAPKSNRPIKAAISILKDANKHEALRAVAAIYVGYYGDASRRIYLNSLYQTSSDYIKAAIYFSSRKWPSVERKNANISWSGNSVLNKLITIGFQVEAEEKNISDLI